KMKVFLDLSAILAAANQLRDFLVERLDADFKLQRAGRKPGDPFAQTVRQTVGNHLEMQEQPRLISLVEKLEDRFAHIEIQVESPIDEFEMPDAALQQCLQVLH